MDNGLGTISFYGDTLYINSTWFFSNVNSKGSCFYIDGSTRLYQMKVTIEYVVFDSNQAYNYGAGFILGNNIWIAEAYFKQITCKSNKAPSIKTYVNLFLIDFGFLGASCGFVDFQTSSSFLILNESNFFNNSGTFFGVLCLKSTNGIVKIFSNIFIQNTLPLTEISNGGAISCNLGYNSTVFLFENYFIENQAYSG